MKFILSRSGSKLWQKCFTLTFHPISYYEKKNMFRLEDGNFIFSIGTPQIKPFQMSTVIMTLTDLCSKNSHSE